MMLRLADDIVAEVNRILFAWTLSDTTDRLSAKDMVLVLEGKPGDIAKVLSRTSKKVAPPSAKERAGIVLRMHEALVTEIVQVAKDGESPELAEVLMGSERSTKVFDLSNYDVVAVEAE
jgi:hypothetical protein